MELAFAMLANAAQISSDGKLHLLGADFNRILARQFPTTIQHMNFVAKVAFTAEECHQQYHLSLQFIAPSGDILEPRFEQDFTPPAPSDPDRRSAMVLVVAINGMEFPAAGRYEVRVSVNGQDLRTLRLYAEEVQSPVLQVQ